MSDANGKAVFLSYASQDAEAARRMAEALRAASIVVWFDQSELRGGDAWDQKIRKQIKECALFVPVISANTQARGEGYFRLEWKLAVERTHHMAEGIPFLAPVALDRAHEADALVPPEFMRVQWTRLADGEPTPKFLEQIKRLLAAPRKSSATRKAESAGPQFSAPPAAPPPADIPATRLLPSTAPAAKPKSSGWLTAVLGVATVTLVAYVALRPTDKNSSSVPSAQPPAAVVPPAAAPQAYNKSIAVLPFENRSDDKANAFFTDGIHEDILTNLAHIAELRVVSRTSVMEYRGTTKKIRQIGQELGVAWLLEGSVQRVGNKVRVTGQLINARTDEHVWAQSYDRDLTDIFAIQSALAQEIARALSATLSPQEKNRLERPRTSSPAAYDLLLRARQSNREGNDTREELETQLALLQSATALDPAFAGAWSGLAATHAQMRFNFFDVSEARLAKARTAMETARRLDPDHPDVIAGIGTFFYYGLRDYPHALEQFERLTRQWPNDYYGHFMVGLVQRRQGKFVESLTNLRGAALLDPGSAELARNLVISLRAMRRFDEAIVEQSRRVRLLPESLRESFELARLHYLARGSTREVDELLAGPIAERADPAIATGYRKLWAAMRGDLATAMRLERELPGEWGEMLGSGRFSPWRSAVLGVAAGDAVAARARVEKVPAELRARLASEPENPVVWTNLALTESTLGHHAEALAAARKAVDLLPESVDSLSGTGGRWGLVVTLAWTGDKDAAYAELNRLLAEPSQVNVHELKHSPWLLPLKGDARFEAIVNDPKNNAPLF